MALLDVCRRDTMLAVYDVKRNKDAMKKIRAVSLAEITLVLSSVPVVKK